MKSNSKKVAGSKEETIILDEQSVVKESDLLTRIVEVWLEHHLSGTDAHGRRAAPGNASASQSI